MRIGTLKEYAAVGLLLISVGVAWGTAQVQLDAQQKSLDAVVIKQQVDHDSITEIVSDVKWIRAAIERKQ